MVTDSISPSMTSEYMRVLPMPSRRAACSIVRTSRMGSVEISAASPLGSAVILRVPFER
jgi:hypothetical protein